MHVANKHAPQSSDCTVAIRIPGRSMFRRNDQSYGLPAQRYAQHCSDVYSTQQLGVSLAYLQSDSDDDTDEIGVTGESKLQEWTWDPRNKKSVGPGTQSGKPNKEQMSVARKAMIRAYMKYNFKPEYQQAGKPAEDLAVLRALKEANAVVPQYTRNGLIKKEGSAQPTQPEMYTDYEKALKRHGEFMLSVDPDFLYTYLGDEAVADRNRQSVALADDTAAKAAAKVTAREMEKQRAALERQQATRKKENDKKRTKVAQTFMQTQKELLYAQHELRHVGGDPKDYGEQSALFKKYCEAMNLQNPACTSTEPVADPVAASSSGLHHPEPVTFQPEMIQIANAVGPEHIDAQGREEFIGYVPKMT